MIRPVRIYGPNVGELVLARVLLALAWVLVVVAIVTIAEPKLLRGTATLSVATFVVALPLFLAAGGVRQNRGAFALGSLLLFGLAIAWIARGVTGYPAAVATGVALAVAGIAIRAIWRQAVRLRFKPRFFNAGQFETMVQVADVMLEGEDRLALNPIQVAVNADHLLAQVQAPALRDLRRLLVVLEYLAPLLTFQPVPFSLLGTAARRRVVERVVFGRGPFRDIARSLKLLACAGYYCTPEGMATVGYVPFDERAGAAGRDRTPATYPLPVVGA